jgi:predicted ATP-grasp superfamily ATP-dependent carboligase
MKTLSLILLTIFLGKGCSNQSQNDIANSVVQYTADTRGYHLKIIVVNQKATISQGRGTDNPSEVVAISDTDWKELVTEFSKINLEEIPNLKDPTQKRFHDGAAIANLKIRYQDKNYETVAFDHGIPPTAIENFVKKIVSLAKEKE